MNFNQAIAIVAEILENTGTHINLESYDGMIIKKLEASNTLDKGRTTNQTHIAITGEQMDIFPYIRSSGYFDNDDADLKKYFITQIPVKLFESNIVYLAGEPITDITFTNGIKISATSVVRSKRQNQADQIQVSLINFDNPDFIAFRRMMNTGSYLVILKEKQKFEYAAFGIKAAQVTDNLRIVNNHFYKLATNTPVNVENIAMNNANSGTQTNVKAQGGTNKIFYGAPGCGKSHRVSDILAEASVAKDNIIRVTFHPEYANCDFIGQILPTVETKADGTTGEEKEIVKYIFNPGPFTLALQTAYDTGDMVYLIIEEINRGNAAAIFGDMFQLLDRVRDSNKPNFCASEYPISNPNMQKYLISSISDETIKEELKDGIFIPSNLTIYATMNSSDQNVFTLDTAFKRRWSFEQISNDITKDADHAYKGWFIPGTTVTWADFLTKLNLKILDYKLQNQTNEDKRLGKYFVTRDCLVDPANAPGNVSEIAQNFAYKVLEYIWNDVCKIGREEWFDTETYKTLEDLIEAFVNPKEGETPLSVFQNITF